MMICQGSKWTRAAKEDGFENLDVGVVARNHEGGGFGEGWVRDRAHWDAHVGGFSSSSTAAFFSSSESLLGGGTRRSLSGFSSTFPAAAGATGAGVVTPGRAPAAAATLLKYELRYESLLAVLASTIWCELALGRRCEVSLGRLCEFVLGRRYQSALGRCEPTLSS